MIINYNIYIYSSKFDNRLIFQKWKANTKQHGINIVPLIVFRVDKIYSMKDGFHYHCLVIVIVT